jgi:Lon protease-like protein
MSPEQARGETDLREASDLYALGLTFHAMLSGRCPFEGKDATTVFEDRFRNGNGAPDDLETEYLSGLIEYFEDEEPEAPEELRSGVLEVFRKMLVLMDVESPKEPGGEGPLSFRVAAAFDFGAPLKQELLESLSEAQRLETLLRVMEALLPQLKLRKDREEAIRGNGKGY